VRGARRDRQDRTDELSLSRAIENGVTQEELVEIKMLQGRSEEQKQHLAEAITKDVMTHANVGEESVSVSIEDVDPGEWTEKVFKPDIASKRDTLYKKPGYTPA
jgi:4-oxalocrotonate tautomerase